MAVTAVNQFAAVLFAAIFTLLTTSPVNGSIYRTSDAIIFEIDRQWDGSFFAKNFPPSQSDFVPINTFLTGGLVPESHIPLIDPSASRISPYSSQGWNFYSWLHNPSVLYDGVHIAPAKDSTSDQLFNQEFKQNSKACGAGPAPSIRIVNGQEAVANSWPFAVGLMAPGNTFVNCGGSLISETKILSAAHCFEKMSMFQLSRKVIKLGMHYLGDGAKRQDDAQATRRISRLTIHKAYNARRSYYDIAILTMDWPVAYTKAISPVCLPPATNNVDIFAKRTSTIMGWGAIVYDGAGSAKLKQATIQTITNADCKAIFTNPGEIVNHMLCASSTNADSCQGDSGGPLVVQGDDETWTQVGIVSFGKGCANPKFPAGVYTKVTWLRGWINTYMKN